jgi:hypothetical protein
MEIYLPKIPNFTRWQSSRLLLILVLLGATGCAGSSMQQSLEADPQLTEQSVFGTTSDSAEAPSTSPVLDQPNDEPDQAAEDNPMPPEAGTSEFIGPMWTANSSDPTAASTNSAPTAASDDQATVADGESDLMAEAPADLQPYLEDLMALEILPMARGAVATNDFQPNQPITRGDYARWLLTVNNQFYADQPAKKIRPALSAEGAAFADVPTTHPNYDAIQGLAEAGLIPSALTGNSTAVTFRPDAPLTRADLVLWKVPLDTRAPLPTATLEAVQATWGFQDAADIEPLVLRAVLADYNNGDFANIVRAFGYTTLLQPQKAVTQAEAAAALWRFGDQTGGISAADLLKQADD